MAGAGLLLLASGRPWTRTVLEVAAGLPRSTLVSTGHDLAPLAAGTGIAGLATLAGVVATRGWLRRLTGLLAAALGLAGALACAWAFVAEEAQPAAGRVLVDETTAWPVVGVAGGVLLLGSGALGAVHGDLWPAMGRRYDTPAGDRRSGRPSGESGSDAAALWDAIERGDDPTAAAP